MPTTPRARTLLCLGLLAFLLALLPCAAAAANPPPQPISFAVIADVQYADKDASGSRHYRDSLDRLEECVADLNSRRLAFTIQLGDLVDSGPDSFDHILPVFNILAMPRYHVLGNHDFVLSRPALLEKLGMDRAYYTFSLGGWRFIVLDAQDLGVGYGWPEDSENYRLGAEMLERLRQQGAANAEDWNGGIGERQKRWLTDALTEALEAGERVIVFGHMPLLAAASAEYALLYNHEEIVQILESSGCVVAYFCGHHHAGGCAEHNGIHYITIQGMVESPERNAYAVITLYDDRIVIDGIGDVPDRVLALPGA